MRKTWPSSKTERTLAFRSRASASDVPNGFSMITRTSAPSVCARPALPSASTITAKNSGAVER